MNPWQTSMQPTQLGIANMLANGQEAAPTDAGGWQTSMQPTQLGIAHMLANNGQPVGQQGFLQMLLQALGQQR